MTTTAEHITARSQSNHDTLEALLGFDLQAERRRRGATQQELAAVIGADKGSVSRWECGIRLPAPHHLLALRAWHAA
jgi:DNA-binding transcriptional regulator YiaG